METIGKRLRQKRSSARLSQQSVADLLKVSKRTIQNHEQDLNRPNRATLEGYAHLYGCSWEWLKTGKEMYRQPEEQMLPRKEHEFPDSGPGQQRLPDNLGRYQVTKVYAPEEGQRHGLHEKLDLILDSEDQGLIRAITYNIEEFARTATERKIPLKPGSSPSRKGIIEM